ncbi:MAG: hypothetical protein PHW53_01800 [Patescibacteria group bacterium]|nr:hypothetical protein [Patescibacteria group bacterium]
MDIEVRRCPHRLSNRRKQIDHLFAEWKRRNYLFTEEKSNAGRKKLHAIRNRYFRADRQSARVELKMTGRVALEQMSDEGDEDFYEWCESMEPHEDKDKIEECLAYEEYLRSAGRDTSILEDTYRDWQKEMHIKDMSEDMLVDVSDI